MKVYSLLGFMDYEGQDLLGVFGSVEDLLKFVESERQDRSHFRAETLGFDWLGYVESELGKQIEDVLEVVEYVEFERYSYNVG